LVSAESAVSAAAGWIKPNPPNVEHLSILGLVPRFHAAPATVADLAATLRQAADQGLAVSPVGAGTKLGLGNHPTRYDLALETTKLAGVLEYRPDDLVAVALAGTTLADIQALLAEHGQWLALDPPHAAAATLGGILAANDSGPHRLRYGTAKDLVLGMQVAYADGTLARSGAKVVKSVAGYDMHKMHVGALGTLGVIVEVGLRLHPLPAERRVLACRAASNFPAWSAMADTVRDLLRLPLGLGGLEALNRSAIKRLDKELPESDLLLVLCEGHARVVGRQADEVRRAAGLAGLTVEEVTGGDQAGLLGAALAEIRAPRSGDETIFKLTVPLGDTLAAQAELEAALPEADLVSHAGSGVVHAIGTIPPSDVPGVTASLRAQALGRQGHLVVRHRPLTVHAGLDVWGPVSAPRLVRGLKQALDPGGVLNPGRFVEGL
jgi:glycolate oxidase FAD binding subunit